MKCIILYFPRTLLTSQVTTKERMISLQYQNIVFYIKLVISWQE